MENKEEKQQFGNSEYMRFVHETLIPHQTKNLKEKFSDDDDSSDETA